MNDVQAKDANLFTWEDPFLLDEQLAEEERLIRQSAHAYAQEKLMPRVEHAFLGEETDPMIFREMGGWDCLVPHWVPRVPQLMPASRQLTCR